MGARATKFTKHQNSQASPKHRNANELELRDLLESGAVRLIKSEWLLDNFIYSKRLLPCRQELPEEAFASAYESVQSIDIDLKVTVISHGWLSLGHPDPEGARRTDFKSLFARHCVPQYVFLDYLSLYQGNRNPTEDKLFREALGSMHLIYSNPHWHVARFLTVPESSPNATPYRNRGWCCFESYVSSTFARDVWSLENGELSHLPSVVPMRPNKFGAKIRTMNFTRGADAKIVVELYDKIWPKITRKNTALLASCWGDAEATDFMDVLPDLRELPYVYLENSKMSVGMAETFADALGLRNIDVYLTYDC